MSELRTVVHIATTNDRANEAREVLKTLRGDLRFDRFYTGPVENWRSPAPDAPTQLHMLLSGDVKQQVDNRLTAMHPAFDVSVEVWEELN